MKNTDVKRDVICSVFVLSIGVFILAFVNQVKEATGLFSSSITSRFWPRLVAYYMIGLAVILLVKTIVSANTLRKQAVEDNNAKSFASPKEKRTMAIIPAVPLTIVLILTYVFLMNKLGFLLDSAVYLFLQMLILAPKNGKKNYLLMAAISIIAAAVIYLIFTKAFTLPMPRGIINF